MAEKQQVHLDDEDMENLHDKGILEKEKITISYEPATASSTEDEPVETQDGEEKELDEGDSEGTEEELEELIDFDGSVLGSKVPLGYMNNKTISQRKTTDAVVTATRQGGQQGKGSYFKRYWGESVEEVGEHDMSKVLGMDSDDDGVLDTDTMTAGEVKVRFKDEYELDDYEERMEKSGVIGKGKSRRKRIFEDEDIMKMMEVILQSKDDPKDIKDKDEVSEDLLNKKISQLKTYMDKHNYSLEDIVDKLKNNE